MTGYVVGSYQAVDGLVRLEGDAVTARVDIPTPTWVLAHPTLPVVYAVSEGVDQSLHTVSTAGGELRRVASAPTGGDEGCHVAFDPSGRYLVVSYYGTGTLTTHAIGDDGVATAPVDTWMLPGVEAAYLTGDPARLVPIDRAWYASGPPEGPLGLGSRAHQAVVDGDEMLVADLGADMVHRVRIGEDGAIAVAAPPILLPVGSGPRHLVVVGDALVVDCEVSGDLWTTRRSGDGWAADGTSVRAAGGGVETHPSDLFADGDLVYVGNRGPSTIGVFRVTPEGIAAVAEIPSGGDRPRMITSLDGQLWIANQGSGEIAVVDRVAPDDYRLARKIPGLASPTCIVRARD
ncbi:beta-propeller fold lactonase family protein [Microbacterium sp. X-17]|uniref:lactonase family protein n=1 Tax=Microbacterium sp. X-17 TaxID=3144404 RepID=UPI0031F51BB1